MKNYTIAFIGIIILVFTGCSKDESVNAPTLMDSMEIDIDEDGITDFNLEYSYVDIEPLTNSDGTFGINGALKPNGLNEILRKVGARSLFLRNIDDIKENVVEPLAWKNTFSRTIVSIATINDEGDWPNKWEISSDTNHSTYFLGLKLVSDIETKLGWFEIEINTSSGSVSIVDKGIL